MKDARMIRWTQVAASKIKYSPDRSAVTKELQHHLQDRYEEHIAQGLTEEEAVKKVLESMGSAEELADQLAAIHKPFWGYLECVTRYIASGLCFILLFVGVFVLNSILPDLFEKKSENPYDDFSYYWERDNSICYLHIEPNISVSSDGYTLTATHFGAWNWRDSPEVGELCVRLTIQDLTPWEEYYSFIDYIWVEDSLGNRYRSEAEWKPKTKDLQIYNTQQGLFTTSFDLEITDIPVQDLEWINICYTRDGRDMVIHIDMTGGEGQ